jgi:hypothetical protein
LARAEYLNTIIVMTQREVGGRLRMDIVKMLYLPM